MQIIPGETCLQHMWVGRRASRDSHLLDEKYVATMAWQRMEHHSKLLLPAGRCIFPKPVDQVFLFHHVEQLACLTRCAAELRSNCNSFREAVISYLDKHFMGSGNAHTLRLCPPAHLERS